jgi:hypothetical protein
MCANVPYSTDAIQTESGSESLSALSRPLERILPDVLRRTSFDS